MGMSRDSVEFTLCARPDDFTATIQAAVRAFGLMTASAEMFVRNGQLIRCRPSQFARFIIYRLEYGAQINRISVLKPRLIVNEDQHVIDVRKN